MVASNCSTADLVEVVFYTDPLCCWSWAMRPVLEQLRMQFGEAMMVRYCMGGLLPGWKEYHDPVNHVQRPIQMGPVWMEAAAVTGAKINTRIWVDDPPSSSYLACIAVKCAGLQSTDAETTFFNYLQEAVMIEGRNISHQSGLLSLAASFASKFPGMIDWPTFSQALENGEGMEAFRKDLQEVQLRHIRRFPSILFQRAGAPGVLVCGYKPFKALKDVMDSML